MDYKSNGKIPWLFWYWIWPHILLILLYFYFSTENSSENIRTAFSIIQAYILLDAETYLQQHGKNIVTTCMYLLTDLRSEGIVMVMRLFESILRSCGIYGVELLKPALPMIFKYDLYISFHILRFKWYYFELKSKRKVTEDDEWQMVMSSYLSIVARILILNQMTFIQVLQELNMSAPFETLMDIWLRKMPLIGQPDKRKLLSKSFLISRSYVIHLRYTYF